MKKGLLVVVSGPSGCGKDTVVDILMKNNDSYRYSVSATTRKPRTGEIDGKDYFFVTHDAFQNMIQNGQILEYTQYCGNYYGTPRSYIEDMLNEGKNVVLKIEVNGALNIKKIYPDSLIIFIFPPDMETLKRRLVLRNTETNEQINSRIAQAREEITHSHKYDYIVYNHDGKADKAAEEIAAIVDTERKKRL